MLKDIGAPGAFVLVSMMALLGLIYWAPLNEPVITIIEIVFAAVIGGGAGALTAGTQCGKQRRELDRHREILFAIAKKHQIDVSQF